MRKEKEYWQCSHIIKCKWVGEHNELAEIKNKQHHETNITNLVCPKCGNKEFFILNEKEYQKLINKSTKK